MTRAVPVIATRRRLLQFGVSGGALLLGGCGFQLRRHGLVAHVGEGFEHHFGLRG